jgi:flagellar hook-basal body complex protein FliE
VPLSPIGPIAPGPQPIAPASRAAAPTGAGATDDAAADFGSSRVQALDRLDASQQHADGLARAAATGDLQRVEDLMIASTETQLATQLTVAVRNRAIESFNEIMRMQL